ncbi:MAG: AEC family transporter [Promethearchaeota archaeon]
MTNVNAVFLLSLIVITIGYFIKKINIIKEEDGDIIAKIIFNLTLPAVILKVTSSIQFKSSLLLLPLINIFYGFLMALIGLLLIKNHSKNYKGIIMMTLVGFNVAHFSFPIIDGIWGEDGMQYIALIDAGNAFTIFVFCYLLGSIFSPKEQSSENNNNLRRKFTPLFKSVPLMSYFIALIINFSGLVLPVFISDLLDIFSRANTLLSLLLLGIFLNFKFEKTEWNIIIKVIITRYLVGLSIGLSLFFVLSLFNFSHLFRLIATVSLILPIGLAVIPFSVEFEYNKKIVTILVNLSIIISFILLWILILVLNG